MNQLMNHKENELEMGSEKFKEATESLAESQLIDSELLLSSVIENAPFPIGVYMGKEMRIKLVNQTMIDTWGKGPDVLGKLYSDILPELDNQDIYRQLDEVFSTGVAFNAKNQRVDLMVNGRLQPFYFNYSFTPMFDKQGNIYGVMNTAADVTALNVATQEIKRSEENLRNVILQAPVAMCIFKSPEHVVEIANQRMYELWGKIEAEVLGRPIFEALPEVKGQGFEELLHSVFTSGETVRAYGVPVTLPRASGIETVYINFVYEAFKEASGEISGVMAVAFEVTEQFISRQKLEESEERLRLALDAGDLGTFELNLAMPDNPITSDKFNKIFGFDQSVNRIELENVIHPQDQAIRIKAHADALTSGKLFYEIRLQPKQNVTKWVRIIGKVLYGKNNIPDKIQGILQDITDQKDLQEQKDNFIAMASHELKTPVTSIKAYAQILEQMFLQKGDIKEAGMIKKMDGQVNRLTNLISDLLNITRINSGKFEYNRTDFDFNALVVDMIEDLQRTTSKHQLLINLGEPAIVHADKERIGQVIINFISNAIKYSPSADLVKVSTTVSGNHVTFTVQDFGIGINSESVDKVFDQFYRVNNQKHQSFQGMGLGLFISSEIIKNESGTIGVKSQEGHGSEFYFTLPVAGIN